MATKKKLTPRTARTTKNILKLTRDNLALDDLYFRVGVDTVYITQERKDRPFAVHVSIPRHIFDEFVDCYNGVK